MCLETYSEYKDKYWRIFIIIDTICIFVYFVEFLIKIFHSKWSYFNNIWNLIDFFTLFISIIDSITLFVNSSHFKFETYTIVTNSTIDSNTTNDLSTYDYTKISLVNNSSLSKISNEELSNISNMFKLLKILRIFRALKALRLLRTIKLLFSLKIILKTCIKSFRSLGAILLLITLTLYNFSVIGCGTFSKLDEKRFGSFFNSMFTLFQVLTLDDWYSIYKINKSSFEAQLKEQAQSQATNQNATHLNINHLNRKENIYSHKIKLDFLILFLIIYLIIEYFIMLNLFIAVLVDNFNLALENSKYLSKKKTVNLNNLNSKKISNDSETKQDYFNIDLNRDDATSNSTPDSDCSQSDYDSDNYF